MPTTLEFRDCPKCGKSIRSTALECYRCGASVPPIAPSSSHSSQAGGKPAGRKPANSQTLNAKPIDESDSDTDHGALPYGGYEGDEDDFDYEEYVDREFNEGKNRRKSFQWYVVWFLIVAISFPLVASLIQLIFG